MLRHYLVVALRNLSRNRLYSAISVCGLALGLAAALIAALYVRNELTYEHFLPGYRDIYSISSSFAASGQAPLRADSAAADLARWLAVRLQIRQIARIMTEDRHGVRVDHNDTLERITWADPELFDIFRFPVIAGDPTGALRRPDGVVLTRTLARRLFGRDDPVGDTLLLDRQHPLRVAAVIEDLPPNTHLDLGIIASSRASFSPFAALDAQPPGLGKAVDAYVYFRLPPAISLDQVRASLSEFIATLYRPKMAGGLRLSFSVVPIAAIHWLPPAIGSMKPRGSPALLYAIAAIGLLILLAAAINFVNLSTARAAARHVEVGVRKASGGTRRDLFVQFVGEALLHSGLALVVALGLAELLLPLFNRLSQSRLTLDYLHDPSILPAAVGFAAVVGVLAGIYPAIVLSSFRTVTALRGGSARPGGEAVRSALVTVQFAVLTGLIISIVVVFDQTSYAKRMAGLLSTTRVFAVNGACGKTDADAFRSLPGVVAAACSASAPLGYVYRRSYGAVRRGVKTFFTDESVDFGFFELYGLKPIAGRFFSRDRGGDAAPRGASATGGTASARSTSAAEKTPSAPEMNSTRGTPIVINETAVHKFGFASAQAAVGQRVNVFGDPGERPPSEIIGVVPDFPVGSIRKPIDATVFYVDPKQFDLLSVKVSAPQEAQALAAIDARWTQLDSSRPVSRLPVAQALRRLYADIEADGEVFSACSAIALLLACAGMYGLASSIAERRTKEMGIRKAMGAGRADVLRLLLRQLTLPVLWAQLLAWPVCYVVMGRWLAGFAYHIQLGAVSFLAASAAAIAIAWVTVLGHALRVARAKPVAALRYE